MKRSISKTVALVAITCFCVSFSVNAHQRKIEPIVSTQWLGSNLNTGLVILDLRSSDAYDEGHIPNSINSPADGWWTLRDELLLEMPDDENLRVKIGALGINAPKKIVLAN